MIPDQLRQKQVLVLCSRSKRMCSAVCKALRPKKSAEEQVLLAKKGPGRPLELPKVVLWSSLLLCVLQGARGVRQVWRTVVLQGYDICDQTLSDRVEQEGTAWLEQ